MSNPFVLLPFIEEAGALDWREYTPIDVLAPHGAVTSGTWKTIADLTGEGYIDMVYMAPEDGVNNQIRVTVDGVLKYRMGSTAAGIPMGVFTDDCLVPSSYDASVPGGGPAGISWTALAGIRYAGNIDSYINASETSSNQVYIIRPFPFQFKSSLKVEIRIDTTNTLTKTTVIQGGIK
jgi:hypothetical protein